MMFRRLTSAAAGVALAATLLGTPGPAAAQDPGSILAERAELDQAMRGDTLARIGALEKFLTDHPDSPLADQAREALVRTHATVGEQALKAGNTSGAAEAFTKALAAAPAKISDRLFMQVIWQMPVVMAASGYRFDGIQLMRNFERRFSTEPARLVVIGNFYVSVESAPDAIRVLEQAVQADPNDHKSYTALGTAYVISLRLDDAANAYSKAIELEPKEEFAYLGLANLRRATGNAAEAIELYKKQLEVKPDDAQSFGGLAIAYLMNDDEAAAGMALGRALALAPGDFRLYTQLGYFYASRGRIPKAREALELSLRYEPRFAWTHITLGNVLIAEKHYKEAIEQLSRAQQFGDFPTLHFELGKAYLVSDQYDAAVEQFKAAFDITEDGQFETSLGDVLQMKTSKIDMLLERERQASLFLYEQPTTATQYKLAESVVRFNHALESIPDVALPSSAPAATPQPETSAPTATPTEGDTAASRPQARASSAGGRDAIVSTLIQTSLMGIAQVPAQTRPRRTKTEQISPPKPEETPQPQPETQPETQPPASEVPATAAPATAAPATAAPSSEPSGEVPSEAVTTPSTEVAPETVAQPRSETPTEVPSATTPDVPVETPSASAPVPETTPAETRPAAPAYTPSLPAGDEVISTDPGVTPGDAPLVFRPRKARPPVVATGPTESRSTETRPTEEVKPDVATPTTTALAPAEIGTRSDGRPVDPAIRETLLTAIDAFVSVDDGREPFRKIWIARRLAEKGVLLERAEQLAVEALASVEPASEPERSIRDMPDIDRAARLAILTARAEDTLGWVLLKRGDVGKSLEHLARGTGDGLKDTDYRQRLWHYAIAKQESGDEPAALDLYIRGYDPASPSAPLRRRQIEDLYRKLNNGTLDGLDQKLTAP